MQTTRFFLLLLILFYPILGNTQLSGLESEDFNFDYYSRFDNGLGTDEANAYTSYVYPDGKVLIGGHFQSYNGTPVSGLVLLNSDGSVNLDFHCGFGASTTVKAIDVQSDGKIWVGGQFQAYDGEVRKGLVRLNVDGTIDLTYSNPGITTGTSISDIEILSDGKIMIGGIFTAINSVTRKNLARLGTDGEIDFSFNPNNEVSTGEVFCVTEHPNGGVVVGGNFTSCVKKLTVNGANDISMGFGGCIGTNPYVSNIQLTPENQFIVSGYFYAGFGMSYQNVCRISLTGVGDPTFNFSDSPNSSIWCSKTLPGGTVLLGGKFNGVNGYGSHVIKLNNDGSVFGATEYFENCTGIARSITETADGNCVVVGTFINFQDHYKGSTAMIDTNGRLVETFGRPTCTNKTEDGSGYEPASISTICKYPNNRLLAGGIFTEYNGQLMNGLVRLFADGTLDTTFNAHFNDDDAIYHVAVQTDGKILVSGGFGPPDTFHPAQLIRLDSTGAIDPTFNSGLSWNKRVSYIHIRPTGKILIAGEHISNSDKSVIQLNTNGSIDPAFTPFSSISSDDAFKIIELSTGKLYVAGANSRVCLLNPNGIQDPAFTGYVYNSSTSITGFAMQPDGKLIVRGPMSNNNHALIRLNTNGTLDNSFDYSYYDDYPNYGDVAVQSDGKILVSKDFTVLRLLENGHPDPDFITTSVFGRVQCIYLEAERFLIGGQFDSINGRTRTDLGGIATDQCTSSQTVNDHFCQGVTYSFGSQLITQPGTYTQTYTNIGGCDSTVTLNLSMIDTADILVVGTTDEIAGNDGSINITVTNTNPYSVLWSNGETSEDLSDLAGGIYTLVITDNLTGCTSTFSVEINSYLNNFEKKLSEFEVFPNPSNGKFIVRSSNLLMTQIELFDLSGREIDRFSDLETNEFQLETMRLTSGAYQLRVTTADGLTPITILIN